MSQSDAAMLLFDELSDITKLLAQEHGYNQARAGHDVVCQLIHPAKDPVLSYAPIPAL